VFIFVSALISTVAAHCVCLCRIYVALARFHLAHTTAWAMLGYGLATLRWTRARRSAAIRFPLRNEAFLSCHN
jgi:hypothetical protein